MATQTEIQLVISAQNKASAELTKLGNDVASIKGKAEKAQSGVASLGKGLLALGVSYAVVKKGLIDSVKAYEESQDADAKLRASLEATGGAAGVTMQSMLDLADSMQWSTRYTDEQVKAAESVVLSFTNIKDNIFPEVIKLSADVAAKFGGEMSDAAFNLALALESPTEAARKLRSMGVLLTTEENKMLEEAQKTNDLFTQQGIVLDVLRGKVGGVAEAMGKTFAGRVEIAKHAVDELQEGIGMGLVNAFVTMTNMSNKSGKEIGDWVTKWKLKVANGLATFVLFLEWVGRMVWDFGALVGMGFYNLGNIIYNWEKDAVNNVMNFGSSLKTVAGAVVKAISGDMAGAANDLANLMPNTMKAMDEAMTTSQQVWDNFGKDTNNTLDKMNTAYAQNQQGVTELSNATKTGYDKMGAAAGDMSKKVAEAAKKIKDLKNEMKAAVKEAEQAIKDFKNEYQKESIAKEKELQTSTAQIIVDKQNEFYELKKQYGEAETAEEKNKLAIQAQAIADFLKNHLADQQAVSQQIQNIKDFQAMDEIQQLQYTFAIEKKQREEDYNDQLKDLKKHLDDVKKEYKKKLKELQKELKADGLLDINITISSTTKSTKKKKAFGGGVNSGEAYMVGEYRPEVFIPSQSGNIKQTSQVGGELNVNFNNVNVRNESDLEMIVATVRRTLNRESVLSRSGITI